MKGVQRMLVPVKVESQPLDVRHKEEHVVVPPNDLVVFMRLYFWVHVIDTLSKDKNVRFLTVLIKICLLLDLLCHYFLPQ